MTGVLFWNCVKITAYFFLLLCLMTASFPSRVERYAGVIAMKQYNMDLILIIKLKDTEI